MSKIKNNKVARFKTPKFDILPRSVAEARLTVKAIKDVDITSLRKEVLSNQYEKDAFYNTQQAIAINPLAYDIAINTISFLRANGLRQVQDCNTHYTLQLDPIVIGEYLQRYISPNRRKNEMRKLKKTELQTREETRLDLLVRILDLDTVQNIEYTEKGEKKRSNIFAKLFYKLDVKTNKFDRASLLLNKDIFKPLFEDNFSGGFVKIPPYLHLEAQNMIDCHKTSESDTKMVLNATNIHHGVIYAAMHDNKSGSFVRVDREDFTNIVIPNLQRESYKDLKYSFKQVIDSFELANTNLAKRIEWEGRIIRKIYFDKEEVFIYF